MDQRIPNSPGRMTEEEYLRYEEAAVSKHEFRDGKLIDMAGGTSDDAKIAMNFGSEIRYRLKGKPCDVFGSDLSVRIRQSRNYCYPDVTVACEPLSFDPPDKRTALANPKLVIEVISPSSEVDDRGDKFTDYRRITSLEEYVLVSQTRYQVETFYKQPDGIWAFGPSAHGIDKSITLRSLGIEVPLAEIYAGIKLPAEESKTESA